MTTDMNIKYQQVKFGEIAKHISKRVEPSETELDIYVGLEHLDPDSLKITRHGVPCDVEGQKLLVKKGQIIFGKRRAYQRKVAVADWDCICSAHAMVLDAIPDKILPEFLPFFMQSNQFMERAVDISEGSLSPTIKWKILEQQTFKIPKLEYQNKLINIVKKIDSYLNQIENFLAHSNTMLIYLRSVIFKQTQHSVELSKIATIIMGQSPKGEFCSESILPNSMPLLNGPTEFTSISPIPKQYTTHITRIAEKEDILFCVRGSTGKMNIADQEYCIGRGLAAIRPKKAQHQRYLYHLLEFIKDGILEQAKGQGSIFSNISSKELNSWNIPDLKPEEIMYSTKIFDKLSMLVQILENKFQNSQQIKMTLINSEL